MSVVGFDFGNLNCYVAVARQGGIEVLTNDYSLHATPSCVSFGPKSRSMGVSARQQANTNIKNTVMNFKQLIGRKFSDSIAQKFREYVPCEVIKLEDDNIGIKVDFRGEQRYFLPEQVLAMLLVKLKEITQAGLHEVKKVTDCVLSVPSYFTDTQRRAVLAALEMAGLNGLRILNETTAVALAYGIYKQDLPPEDKPPRIVAFVDIGHSATQAALVAYNKGKLAVVGTTFSFDVSGLVFDSILREHFRNVFMEQYKIDAKTNPRAWLRLLDECEKLKKQMSANSTAIPLNIECLMNDKDVTAKLKRSEFEDMIAPQLERLKTLLMDLLKECEKKPEDIESVEIIGGSSRVPAVKKVIADVFKQDPKTTMNQDEAVARGAAMQSAILSPSFRVREFAVKDCQPYRIRLSWGGPKNTSEEAENDVFVERAEFPYSKAITFYRDEPFQLSAFYAYPNLVPCSRLDIGTWYVNGVTPTAQNEKRKVKVKVRVNPNGIFSVCSATAYENEIVETKPEEKPAKESKEAKEQKEPKEPKEPKEKGPEPMEVDTTEKDASKENSPAGEETKPKTKTIAKDLPVEENTPYYPNIERFITMEQEMQKDDRSEKEKADAKNSVEEYVYFMRDKLADQYAPFITEKDAETFQGLLQNTEDWLYGEGEDAKKQVYEKKLAELKKLGDPVQERYREFENRAGAFDNFDRAIIRARKAYEEYAKGSEKYSHLESKDMEKVINAVEEKKKWIDEQRGKQERRPKTDPPVVYVHQINQELQTFENIVSPILNKPKPKPPAPKKEEKKEAPNPAEPATADEKANPAGKEAMNSTEPAPTNNPEMEVD